MESIPADSLSLAVLVHLSVPLLKLLLDIWRNPEKVTMKILCALSSDYK